MQAQTAAFMQAHAAATGGKGQWAAPGVLPVAKDSASGSGNSNGNGSGSGNGGQGGEGGTFMQAQANMNTQPHAAATGKGPWAAAGVPPADVNRNGNSGNVYASGGHRSGGWGYTPPPPTAPAGSGFYF